MKGVFIDSNLTRTPAAKNRVVTFFPVAFTRESEAVRFLGVFLRFERGHCGLRISNIDAEITELLKGVFVDCALSRTPVDKNRVVALFLVAFTRETEAVRFLGLFLRFDRDHCGLRISNIDAEILKLV